MQAEQIKNMDQVQVQLDAVMKMIKGTILGILESSKKYFTEENETGLYRCPSCDYEFMPEEADISLKTFGDWWRLQEKSDSYIYHINEIVDEHIYKEIVNIVSTIDVGVQQQSPTKGTQSATEQQLMQTIEGLKPLLHSITKLNEAMNVYKEYASKQESIPDTMEFATLKSMDRILTQTTENLQKLAEQNKPY